MYRRSEMCMEGAGISTRTLQPTVRAKNGFTLLEVLIVVVLFSVLVSLTAVVSIDSYRSYSFRAEQNQLRALVLQARSRAVNNIRQTPHGVRINQTPLQYVLFEGADYAHRNASQDVVITGSATLTVGGLSEIVFTQLTGQPNTVGSFTLSDGIHPISTVSINNEGQINLQ